MTTETAKGHILVVDDDKIIRKICQNALEPAGFAVSMAENGQQALEMVSQTMYDLLLTDMEMPVMDGMTLLQELQKVLVPPPVIMFTSHAYVPHAVQAISRGAYDFITKPFMTDALLVSVNRCLDNARMRRETNDLRSLNRVMPVLQSAHVLDSNKVMQVLLAQACELLRAEGGSLLLYEQESQSLVVKALGGPFSENVIGRRVPTAERVVGQA